MRASAQRRSREMYKRLVKREKAELGMSANKGNNKGAYMSSVSIHGPRNFQPIQSWLLLPGRRHLHRKERGYEYTERGLLVLRWALVYTLSPQDSIYKHIHLLKLLTGVEISTRPVRRSGKEGKPRKRSSRSAEAAPNNAAFRRSMTIVIELKAALPIALAMILSPHKCPSPEFKFLLCMYC